METAHLVLDQLPIFKIDNFSSHRHRHFQCVVANGEVFHRVYDLKTFYATFGYGKEAADLCSSPDEYIWEMFTRAGAPRSRACLQRLIIHYLRQHSLEFKQLYGSKSEALVAQCAQEKTASAPFCCVCFMHPNGER